MDAFFASVEENVNPHLKGKPIFVGGKSSTPTVVAACSYPAKYKGVKTGMSLKQAYCLCPDAIFVPGKPERYIWCSEQIYKILLNFTPEVEIFSIDEFFLDITDIWERYTSPTELGAIIKNEIKLKLKLPASVGIGPNKLIAKLASKKSKPDGLMWIKEKEIIDFIDSFPLEDIPGIGPSTEMKLKEMGVFSTKELRYLSLDLLKAKFGNCRGEFLYQIARGIDHSKVLPEYRKPKEKSISESKTFKNPLTDKEGIKINIRCIAENLSRKLRLKGYYTDTIYLFLRFSNLEWVGKRKKVKGDLNSGIQIYRVAIELLKEIDLRWKIVRAIGLSCANLKKERQYEFFRDAKEEILNSTIDLINLRFGSYTIYPASYLEASEELFRPASHGFLHKEIINET
jgi:DNA polymerase-4